MRKYGRNRSSDPFKGDWISKAFPWVFGVMISIIIFYWISIVVTAVFVFEEIREEGLKSVVEEVWEGSKDPNE